MKRIGEACRGSASAEPDRILERTENRERGISPQGGRSNCMVYGEKFAISMCGCGVLRDQSLEGLVCH